MGQFNPQDTSWQTPTGTPPPSANGSADSAPSAAGHKPQLATKLGIHQKQVSGYERGIHVPQTELLIRIAETFGVSLDHLAFADRDNTDHARIADRELLEKLQALDQLPDTERAVVKSVLDTYITKHRIQQLTGTGEPAA